MTHRQPETKNACSSSAGSGAVAAPSVPRKRPTLVYDRPVERPRRTADEIRQAIVDAAITVVGRDGMGALTHRAVAAQAGVSLSSTTYHFASKQAITRAAVEQLAEAERARAAQGLEELRQLTEAGRRPDPSTLVAMLIGEASGHDPRFARAAYELQLQAVDDAELQPIVRRWFDAAAELVEAGLAALGSSQPVLDARIVVAAVEGLRLNDLTTASSPARDDELRATLIRLLALTVPPS